jgi:hypothetical protein
MAGRRTRKTKQTEAPEAIPLTPEEQAIQDKYPDRVIKAGSLVGPGRHPDFPKKKSVVLICPCGNEHRRATQDVFQTKVCFTCKKAGKKAKKEGQE